MSLLAAVRYLRAYRADAPAPQEEVQIRVRGEPTDATLISPRGGRTDQGWVVLHGLTVGGRQHPALLRFARALAEAGGTVLIPEVAAWRALWIDPAAAADSVRGALPLLQERTGRPGVGVVGFSFGATHALIAATDPELRTRVAKVVGFGGYADLGRTIRCMFTGEHEWAGVRHRLDPDPYGRWIAAANYLTHVPAYAELGRVADAAHRLATEAGRRAVFAGAASLDPFKAELRGGLDAAERRVWDVVAPPTSEGAGDTQEACTLATQLAEAALRTNPALDPRPALRELTARAILVHGRTDRLVPFTEMLRLREALPPSVAVTSGVTGLLAHSGDEGRGGAWERTVESARFLRLLSAALEIPS